MRKIIIIVLAVVFLITAAACGKQSDKITFSGTITEINGDNAIVKPFDGETILSSADKISINLSSSNEIFAVGDEITVEYDGTIMESYPAQVNVLGIEKIS